MQATKVRSFSLTITNNRLAAMEWEEGKEEEGRGGVGRKERGGQCHGPVQPGIYRDRYVTILCKIVFIFVAYIFRVGPVHDT